MAQTKVTGGLISTTSNYEVGVITATKFVGPFEGTTATFTGDVDIKGTLSYVDVDNITATGIITAQDSVQIGAGLSVAGISTFTGAIDANSTSEFAGVANFSSGVGIADSIFHIGDTNTAIRFPGNDTFSVETAGQQNVQVTADRTRLTSPSGTNTTVRLQHQGNSGYGDIILDRTVNAFIIDNDPSNASNNQSYFSVKNKGTENLRITHDGKVSISSDGTADGLLTIKGNSDATGTPSIRLLDGGDTREVSISNESGDFIASVHGTDNATHGHIKMFESGIIDFNNGGASGSNTNRLRITSGVVASFGNSSPPAWANDTGYYNIQLGKTGFLRADTDTSNTFMTIGQNAYKDSGGWKYAQNGGASSLFQQNGVFIFESAGSGTAGNALSLTEKLRIDSSGNVLVGTTDTTVYSNSSGEGIVLRNGEAIDIARSGDLQLTLNRMSNEGPNIALYQAGGFKGTIGTKGGGIYFGTSGDTERLRIDSAGRLLYGTTSSTRETSLQLVGNSNSYTTNPGVIDLFVGNTPSNLGSMGQICFGTQDKVGARIDGRADQDWTLNSARGTHLRFLTCANGSTSLTERLRINSAGKVGLGVADPKSLLHMYGPGDLRIGSLYGGVALIALQVSYASGYTGTHFMVEITDQASYSFEGSHIVHGQGGSSYGTEVTVVRMQASREAGATNSGDTWRNGTVKYNNNFTAHDQVGLNPGAGSFSFTYDDAATTTTSIQKMSFSASGQGVGVWAKMQGVFTWASASTNGRVKIKDKDGNVLWDSNP